MKDLPDPSDMLEELADKVIVQMDRLAVTSFQTALDEMLDFHRFLIDAYATNGDSGNPDSFARLGDWGSLHENWGHEYRRLFERAVEHIGRENDFIGILAYVPKRLLPTDGRRECREVTAALLDLVNILVHPLEGWVTRHRTLEATSTNGCVQVPQLAGSDQRAYEDVIIGFVGAWEGTLQLVNRIYDWRTKEIDVKEQWQRYKASWPFIQRHLRNTSYLLAVAVWNEDEIAAGYYCEALLRWFNNLEHDLDVDHLLVRAPLTPNLLDLNWPAAQSALVSLLIQPVMQEPHPSGIFTAILQNALADTIVIAVGVMLAWFIENRQVTDIAPKIVLRLLGDEPHEDGRSSHARETGFRATFLDLIRIREAGGRFAQSGYGAVLDGLVEKLDGMTERRVVPGRVFTPSTRHERDDLRLPWLCCLAALLPDIGEDNTIETITRWTKEEEAFRQGDTSLRHLVFDLKQMKACLDAKNREYLARGVRALCTEADIDERLERLAALLDNVSSAIEEQRAERLRAMSIDANRLEFVRLQVERSLTDGDGGIHIFQGFRIVRSDGELPQREFTMRGIKKGFLTEPVVEHEPTNWSEKVVISVQRYAVRLARNSFAERPRRTIEAVDEETYRRVMKKEAAPLILAGRQPVMLVRSWNDPPWAGEWFGWRGERPTDMQVTRKEGIKSGLYLGTVDGIDVYRANLDEAESLLFPADLLREVKYGTDAKGRVVTVTFEEEADHKPGKLVFRFSQQTEWMDDEVIVLQYSSGSIENGDI